MYFIFLYWLRITFQHIRFFLCLAEMLGLLFLPNQLDGIRRLYFFKGVVWSDSLNMTEYHFFSFCAIADRSICISCLIKGCSKLWMKIKFKSGETKDCNAGEERGVRKKRNLMFAVMIAMKFDLNYYIPS